MARSNSAKSLRAGDFTVNEEDRPGWTRGSECAPIVGENVYCAGGEGVVAQVLGKTGDGSRLLEIHLSQEKAAPFFAASSNVLVLRKSPGRARKRKPRAVPSDA